MSEYSEISVRRLALFWEMAKEVIRTMIGSVVQPSSEKEVLSVLTYGTAPSSAEDGDYYIKSSNNKLFIYDEGWVEDTPNTDTLYVTADTSRIYVWNGERFIDQTGELVNGMLVVVSKNDLSANKFLASAVYNCFITSENKAYTFIISNYTDYTRGVRPAETWNVCKQTLQNADGYIFRTKIDDGPFGPWESKQYAFAADYAIWGTGPTPTSGSVVVRMSSGLNAGKIRYTNIDIQDKADKLINSSASVSSNVITLNINKVYDLTSIGPLTSSNTIHLSETGAITNECPQWHFFFECGSSEPELQLETEDVDVIWDTEPDWSNEDLVEVNVIKVGVNYFGLWSKKKLD